MKSDEVRPGDDGERVKILLVDDQPAKLLSYEVILNELDEKLITVGSAREALGVLLKVDVALVLIDVCMPEVDGIELASMIREHPRYRKTPLIFVSAQQVTELDSLRGYEAGAVDYVPVPIIPEVLRAKVRVFVDLFRKSRELERLNAELETRVAERTASLEDTAADLEHSRSLLLTQNDRLEQLVEQRTREREAALARLFEAQKMDTIGQLTGGIAHDFNNLLMVVLGSLELLKRRLPSDEERWHRLLDNALQGAERGKALTQRLLAFARRQDLAPEPVALSNLVSGMGDLLERAAGPAVQLNLDLPQGLPRVLVDANQLELALLNLTVNARDAMPVGGSLAVTAREYQHESVEFGTLANLVAGRYVCLEVADTGQGMDETTLSRATEPFFTSKGVGKGTGLGLSMVHGLAAQSGGAMSITSKLGSGTEVRLYLPSTPDTSHVDKPSTERVAGVECPVVQGRILLVDDDQLVREGTAAMLEDLGHLVVEACSGARALEVLACEIVDLVITDQAMPGMTGLELVSRLKQTHPDLPVILASGFAELAGCEDAKGLTRLAKPYYRQELGLAVSNHLAPVSQSTNVIRMHRTT